MSTADRLKWIHHLIHAGLLTQLWIGQQAWLRTSLDFPTAPLIPLPFDGLLAYLLIMLVLLISWYVQKTAWTLGLVGVLVLSSLSDLNRLQEWLYLYLWLLCFLHISKLPAPSRLLILRCTLAIVYFWSGLQKWNIYYVEDTLPWLLEPFFGTVDGSRIELISVITSSVEIGIGLGLIWNKTARVAACIGIGMHVSILFVLIIGHQFNWIVWPWNLVMIGLLVLTSFTNQNMTFPWRKPMAVFLFLFAILPGLNWIHLWPDSLSFKLYSGNKSEMLFFFQSDEKPCLITDENSIEQYSIMQYGSYYLNMNDWAFDQRGMPPFQDLYAYRKMGMHLCDCIQDKPKAGIAYIVPSRWDKQGDKLIKETCEQLKAQ